MRGLSGSRAGRSIGMRGRGLVIHQFQIGGKDPEDRTGAWRVVRAAHANPSAMLLRDALTDPQAQPGSGFAFGAEKRLEDPAQNILAHAPPVVGHRKHHALAPVAPIRSIPLAQQDTAFRQSCFQRIAHKIGQDKCTIYSEDISQKSSNLLRLNLILNNLSHSIDHIVQGNTITEPKHVTKKFDFIVSNPPFKIDFSNDHERITHLPNVNDRFFAGIPKIPNKDKDKMAIYLLFIQHILFSLSDNGRAAVVVPTGFLTAQSGIEKAIRTKLVDNHWLKGVVSMPSNIFATTGTNVSVLFIDKTNNDGVTLVDASKLGTKVKDGKNQKTLLNHEEEQKIIDAFKSDKSTDDFSERVTFDQIKKKNYSFSAGQYFDIKIEYKKISKDEFLKNMTDIKEKLDEYFNESQKLEDEIKKQINGIKYE